MLKKRGISWGEPAENGSFLGEELLKMGPNAKKKGAFLGGKKTLK